MASAPQPQLPMFYNDLMPLNSQDHVNYKTRPMEEAKFLGAQHALPVTVDEFVQAQRYYPIVFSSGDSPVPLALMGLNEGVNTFIDKDGKITDPVYIPAYVRRYPFMLAKLRPDTDDLSLCFDPTSGAVGEFDQGEALFDKDGKATETVTNILNFCEQFETAGRRTQAFMDELKSNGLLMDGEIAITMNDQPEKPFVYRGFQMVDQEKLRAVGADKLKEWHENGLLMLIHAHMFSLDLMRTIFGRQVQQGTAPAQAAE